ncbi:E3 ubiquitin- ligase RNF19A [Brachionus plicatilis]|uniref:E3 ubiquitin-ligase RNF19A n=1 Tax=Brachionus plicatilis TaxID=10195 RepID=A0A3M7SX86_BRAPC|nr:E3 ubiquitin- ligase RNF19A [Brachionus plicatilis]
MNKSSQTSTVDEDDDGGHALKTCDRKSTSTERVDSVTFKTKPQKSARKTSNNNRMQPINTRLRSVVEILRNRFNHTSSSKRNSTMLGQVHSPSEQKSTTPRKPPSEPKSEESELTCQLCYLKFEKNAAQNQSDNFMYPMQTCDHSFCAECLRQYLKYQIIESRVSITCPECNEKMHPSDIYKLLRLHVSQPESASSSPKSTNSLIKENVQGNKDEWLQLIYKYEEFMVRRVLVSIPDIRWCPAPDCTYAVIASGCANCPQLYCQRPGCNTSFCYHCKQYWHPNLTCEDAALKNLETSLKKSNSTVKLRNLLQRSNSHTSQSSSNGVNQNWASISAIQSVNNRNSDWCKEEIKQCPKCQALIVKMDDGSCNHITCPVCGCEFCWLCMKEISDLHYLSPSGCTFWGKKPWSRKKKIMWQLGTLIGAPVGIALIAGVAVPAILIGLPIWSGRKVYIRYKSMKKHKRNLIVVGTVFGTILVAPVVATLAVAIGVPILLAYVYGVVPISLCRGGGCGVTTNNNGGVRFEFEEENTDNNLGLYNLNNTTNQAISSNTANSVTVPISAIEPKPDSVVVSTQSASTSIKTKKNSLQQTPLYVTITMASNSINSNSSKSKSKSRTRSTSNRRRSALKQCSQKKLQTCANACGSVEVSKKESRSRKNSKKSGIYLTPILSETGTGTSVLNKMSDSNYSSDSSCHLVENFDDTKSETMQTGLETTKSSQLSTRRSSESSKRLNETSIKKLISTKIVNNPSISEMSIGLASLSATSAFQYKEDEEDEDSLCSKTDLCDRESASNKALTGGSVKKLKVSKSIKFSDSVRNSILDGKSDNHQCIEIKSNYTLNSLENKTNMDTENCSISIESEKSANPSTLALIGSIKDDGSVHQL